jgi:hypothetical protein
MPSLADFLDLLFDLSQVTCYTDTPHGYKVRPNPKDSDVFFCINALHPYRDLQPTKEWHNAAEPRRADCNVVCYRNFLIELDDMPLEEQIEYVTSKIPVSSIVYSGGSSYHFIVSLEHPVSTQAEYATLARRLLKLLPAADKACKNPSRLSRLPFRTRKETGRMQSLKFLGQRIPIKELEVRLPKVEERRKLDTSTPEARSYISSLVIEATAFPDRVMRERNLAGRNLFFYWIGQRMAETDMPLDARERMVEQAYNNLQDTSGFSYEEALMAARVRGH